jgi:uncharacterized membrane protein YphA (DoxX/SURF4 family)
MTNPLRTEKSLNLGLLLARLPMGAFFLIAGIQKLHMGIDRFVGYARSSGSAPRAVPPEWVNNYLHAVPFLELAVGTLLILGLVGRLGGLIGALMVISFTIGYSGLHGQSPSDQGLPFHPNLIYLGLLLLVFLAGPGRISLDGLLFGRKRAG